MQAFIMYIVHSTYIAIQPAMYVRICIMKEFDNNPHNIS